MRQGIAILAQLYTETRAPAFVFNQGRCYQQNGQLEAARLRFAEYLRIGRGEPPADIQRARRFSDGITRRWPARRPPRA